MEALAPYADIVRISEALRQVDEAKESLDYNVSPETCFDVALMKVREVFDGAGSTS